MQELNIVKHIIDKYVVISMYFEDIDNAKKFAKIVIIKEVHLVKDFKARLLIENDVLSSESIDIFNFTELVFIKSCEIIIQITTKSIHKFFWFEKVVTIFLALAFSTSSTSDCVLSNEIIIHNSTEQALKTLTNLVEEYFKLWIDQEFANFSIENWMKISLKSNWENKIKEETKMYFIKTKDRKLLNNTFDKLHDQDKLF